MHIVKCQYEDWKIIPTDLANNIFAKNTLKEVSFAFSLNDWGDFCLMKERENAKETSLRVFLAKMLLARSVGIIFQSSY
jgi:hypothetical protein